MLVADRLIEVFRPVFRCVVAAIFEFAGASAHSVSVDAGVARPVFFTVLTSRSLSVLFACRGRVVVNVFVAFVVELLHGVFVEGHLSTKSGLSWVL